MEQQAVLDQKLQELQRRMTKDAVGLVSSTTKDKGKTPLGERRRTRPLSLSTASLSSANPSSSRSQQSLSSISSRSPHGSIPSIPSSPPHLQPLTNWRSHHDNRKRYSQTHEDPQSSAPSSPRMASPIPRHLSPPGKSSSPPTISNGRALGHTHARGTPGRSKGSRWQTDVGIGSQVNGRVSEHGSEASSFSDLSDASLSASALESALLSNIRAGGSRLSSFARSNLTGRRGVR